MSLGALLGGIGTALNAYEIQMQAQQQSQLKKLDMAKSALELQHLQQQSQIDLWNAKLDGVQDAAKNAPQQDPATAPYQVQQFGGGGGGPLPGAQPMQQQQGQPQGQGIPPGPLFGGARPPAPPQGPAGVGGFGGPSAMGGAPQGQPQQQQAPAGPPQPPTPQDVMQGIMQRAQAAGVPVNTPQAMMAIRQRVAQEYPKAVEAYKLKLEAFRAQQAEADRLASRQDREQFHADTEADRAAQRSMTAQFHADNEADRAVTRALIASRQNLDDDPNTARVIDAIGQYKAAPPNISSSRNPKNLQLMGKVYEKYPDYDATKFGAKQSAMKDFAAGTDARTYRSNGVALSHLDVGDQLITALGNKDMRALNAIKNRWQTEFGSAAPTNFNAAKTIIADEVAKAVVGTTGSQADRDAVAAPFLSSNSPEQLRGAIQTYKALMAGQKKGLEEQYKRATGENLAEHPEAVVPPAGAPTATDPKTGHKVQWNGKAWVDAAGQ